MDVDFDRRCRLEDLDLDLCLVLGDLDLVRFSSFLDDILELLFLSLALLWMEISIMGIMSGNGDVPRPGLLLSSDFEVLAFSLEGFDSDSDADAEELSDLERDCFTLSASLYFFFFFLFFFFPPS